MGYVLLFLLLALLLGGVGFAVEGLFWLIFIAAAFAVASAVSGFRLRRF